MLSLAAFFYFSLHPAENITQTTACTCILPLIFVDDAVFIELLCETLVASLLFAFLLSFFHSLSLFVTLLLIFVSIPLARVIMTPCSPALYHQWH